MTKKLSYLSACLVLAVGLPIIVPAQDLPTLPVAPQIKTGRLGNGVSYYLVTNGTDKGTADIALVQRTGRSDETGATAGETAVQARASFCDLPHFTTITPFGYLGGRCILPEKNGYVTVYDDATVFRFRNLVLSRSKDIIDSTLLMLFDIIDRDQSSMSSYYAPQNQAIVVSGDIDASAVLGKMNLLSLLVTRRQAKKPDRTYAWTETDGPLFRFENVPGPTASITAEYASPRTPERNMNTVQPLVSQKFAGELGILLRKRLRSKLQAAGIPVSAVDYRYVSSGESEGDETYSVTVRTSADRLGDATMILAATLADLDRRGSIPEEYRDVQNQMVMDIRRTTLGTIVSNAAYTDQCISSFLYGSSLASAQTNLDFFTKRNVGDETGVRLFNNFLSALLDKTRNLHLTCRGDTARCDAAALQQAFSQAWDTRLQEDARASFTVDHSDTVSLSRRHFSKTKLKTMTGEPVTGGEVWTFNNGIQVVYKPVSGTDLFRFTWLLKGGCGLVPGLKPDESAYIADLLGLYDVAGLSGSGFRNMLEANGIRMETTVSLADMRISGTAPPSRLHLVLKSLEALANERSLNMTAYDYYRACRAISPTPDPGRAVLDSLFYPGSVWASVKKPIPLADDLPRRADRYFSGQFAKMNDGILIIVGNFDSTVLKRILSQYLGAFHTNRSSVPRNRLAFQATGTSATATAKGPAPSLDFAWSAPLTYTAENYLAASVAAYALEDAVARAAADAGWFARNTDEFGMFPEDRFSVYAHLAPVPAAGLPATMLPLRDAEAVREQVESAVKQLGAKGITAAGLAVHKARLGNWLGSRANDPETLMEVLVLRYSYGKDLRTRYTEKLAAVSLQKVNEILFSMASGPRTAYVVETAQTEEPFDPDILPEPPAPEIPPFTPPSDTTGFARLYWELLSGQADSLTWTPVQTSE